MRKLLVLASLLAISATHPAFARSDRSKVVKKALTQSVRLEVHAAGKLARSASGVVVASQDGKSWILTNAHVVQRDGLKGDPQFTVVVERPRLHRLSAHVVKEGRVPDQDLALVQVDEVLAPVPLALEDDVSVGDDVVVIGAPYGRALSVSSGIVSQLEQDDAAARPVQTSMKTDAPIGYGASGGGVFDVPGGKLVGIVEGYRTARVAFGGMGSDDYSFDIPMPGETFVAPPSKIRAFLSQSLVAHLIGLTSDSAMSARAPRGRTAPPRLHRRG